MLMSEVSLIFCAVLILIAPPLDNRWNMGYNKVYFTGDEEKE